MFEELKVEVGERRLEPGDTLIIYSDGVVEAQTDDGKELGEERLTRSHTTTPVPELAKALVDGVFESFPRQTDDTTLVAARAR